MANDIKMGVGFIIPAAGVVGFFISLILGEFLISIIISILGILSWFLYMLIMESNIPKQTGNMIILFGVLLSIGIFAGFGIKQNMFGGYEFENNGSIFSLIILFFSILTGLNFRKSNIQNINNLSNNNGLSDSDRELVMNAIKKSEDKKQVSDDPKIIVVKQENKKEDKAGETANHPISPDPYGMANNPYFAYPPDYYGNEEYEDEEYEDEEYEDEEYEDEEYEEEKN